MFLYFVMTQSTLLITILILLLALAGIFLLLFQRFFSHKGDIADKKTIRSGAYRGIFHSLWTLLIWSALAASSPLFFSIRAEIFHSSGSKRMALCFQAGFLLLVLLVVIFFQRDKGTFRWIENLTWPKKDYE